MVKNIDRIISECLHRVLTEDMDNISQGIINSLRKGCLDDRYYDIWQDIEDDEKLYYLWESEFSGLCHLETFIECGVYRLFRFAGLSSEANPL